MNYEHGSSAESVFSGFGSSSGLNTPAGSDLDSLESEEDDFMAELTRKMAENMLLEDDNKTTPLSPVSDNTAQVCTQPLLVVCFISSVLNYDIMSSD